MPFGSLETFASFSNQTRQHHYSTIRARARFASDIGVICRCMVMAAERRWNSCDERPL